MGAGVVRGASGEATMTEGFVLLNRRTWMRAAIGFPKMTNNDHDYQNARDPEGVDRALHARR